MKAVVAGLGKPGNTIGQELLRMGWHVWAADPKPVNASTVLRAYGRADVGKPKVLAFQEQAAAMGYAQQLDARLGRVEHMLGGQEWRAADLVVLATDRPIATRLVTDICLRTATPSHPTQVVSSHVSDGAVQVRSFLFPTAGGPCPLCSSGDAFLSSIVNEDGFSCDQALPHAEGDAYTMPYGAVEGLAAAALALRVVADHARGGTDTTLLLSPGCEAFVSRLRCDDSCLLDCAHAQPWPEATASLETGDPLAWGLTAIAAAAGLDPEGAAIEFLRPLALGTSCGCGTTDAPQVFRNPCPRCSSPVVARRGWVSQLPLAELPAEATAATLALPPHDLVLLVDPTKPSERVTVAVGGVLQDD